MINPRVTCSARHLILFFNLMTLSAPHWAFRQRDRINQDVTLATICFKFSGSDRMIVSNSANLPDRKRNKYVTIMISFVYTNKRPIAELPIALSRTYGQNIWRDRVFVPGLKNTLVRPNLKSLSSRPRALNSALQNSRGSNEAKRRGRNDLYRSYKSWNGARDG